jgi:hypothetical protein
MIICFTIFSFQDYFKAKQTGMQIKIDKTTIEG